jgi:hypothetical protein
MDQQSQDQEIEAIRLLVSILEPLDENARQRVLDYVIERLGISTSRRKYQSPSISQSTATDDNLSQPTLFAGSDIRSLKDSKAPETAIEMAVIVAYYLSELAPLAERKSTINSSDLRIYFKQAKFPLPKSIEDVLPNAKKSGYVEAVARGEYKLNSVGYNLAVHGLPR